MKVLISCHIDTVFRDPYCRMRGDGFFTGACDNFAGVMAMAQLIENIGDDPDVKVEFTEDEEHMMDGARTICKKENPEEVFLIVIDVTDSLKSIKNTKIHFTVENWHCISEDHLKKALKPYRGQYLMVERGTESEAWMYRDRGFSCVEIDIPTFGGLHSLDSKARIKDILVASQALLSLISYIKIKTRQELVPKDEVDYEKA